MRLGRSLQGRNACKQSFNTGPLFYPGTDFHSEIHTGKGLNKETSTLRPTRGITRAQRERPPPGFANIGYMVNKASSIMLSISASAYKRRTQVQVHENKMHNGRDLTGRFNPFPTIHHKIVNYRGPGIFIGERYQLATCTLHQRAKI